MGAAPARFFETFPADIPPGEYFVGWIIDPLPPGDNFGEVGEWDETSASNSGHVTWKKLTVRAFEKTYTPLVAR